jgi:NDP-sugar pyrophosphorylase family protein
MKAMILAAGYGTRLRPITYLLPKPMVPLCGKPLIAWAIEALMRAGVRDFVVNLHHLPDAIRRDLPPRFPDAHFDFSFEPEILGTGGGVRKVRSLLEREDEFLLVNGDSVASPPYDELLAALKRHDSLAALTLRHPPPNDRFTPVFFKDGLITGFGAGRGEALMFSGTHVITSRIFRYLPDRDFSGLVEDVYKPLLENGSETLAGVVDDGLWFDIGTPQRVLAASQSMPNCAAVGARSTVDGELRNSVIWDDCRIGRGVKLESCIVAHGVTIAAPMRLQNAIVCRDDVSIPRDAGYRFESGLVIAQF